MKKPKNFEEGIAHLEQLLDGLNDSNTSLEESLKLYADAAQTIEYCSKTLSDAKLQIDEIGQTLQAVQSDEAHEGDDAE